MAPQPAAGRTATALGKSDCQPGVYKGSYSCEVDYGGFPIQVDGEVVFTLESVQTQSCAPGAEFCGDLVISKNSGTLQGQAMLVLGFETTLDGALDCSKRTFRATAVDGRWGAPVAVDPGKPEGAWKVSDPPFGTFSGELMGSHAASAAGQTIQGSWSLHELSMDLRCDGPFMVSLQP
jgi:hypothetical protein